MKKLLLFIAFCSIFTAHAQFRLVNDYGGTGEPVPLFEYNNRLYVHFSTYLYHTNGLVANNNSRLTYSFPTDVRVRSDFDSSQYVFYNGVPYLQANFNIGSQSGANRYLITRLMSTNKGDNVEDLYYLLNGSCTQSRFQQPTVINNTIVFSVVDGCSSGSSGNEPAYYTPGSSVPNILQDLSPGSSSSNPVFGEELNGFLYFSAESLTTTGRELYRTDGTFSNTTLYLDLNTGMPSSDPDYMIALGSQLIFVATHPTLGRELFKTNGSGSLVNIRNINLTGDSNPTNVTKIGSKLYLSANNGTSGQELWVSDGNNLGTALLKDINPAGDSNPSKFTLFGSDVYFIADDGVNGVELWKTDGTNVGTVMVKNINPTGSSNPTSFIEYNGKLYFSADNGTNGRELWVTDGTSTGTVMLELYAAGDGMVNNLFVFNNEIYFSADDGTPGNELYAYRDPSLSTYNFQLNDGSISLFPNPSKNYFELSGDVSIEKVAVYSLQGQLVKSFDVQNQYNVSDLAKGMYLLQIKATEGSLSKSLIIE